MAELIRWEIWTVATDRGDVEVTLVGIDYDGQSAVIATTTWAEPISPSALGRWITRNMKSARIGVRTLN